MENEFLEAIRQQPDDKNLRLEYADWLAGQGHAERAEFLRLHTALGGVYLGKPVPTSKWGTKG